MIRVSLVSDTPPHYPHPHILDMGQQGAPTAAAATASGYNEAAASPPHFIEQIVSAENDHIAM